MVLFPRASSAVMLALAMLSFGKMDAQTFTAPYNFSWDANDAATNADGAIPEALILSGGTFYGTASSGGPAGSGTVFSVNPDGTGLTVLQYFSATGTDAFGNSTNADGAGPSGLTLYGGTLYGTASSGGVFGKGTVFSVSTNGGGFTVLHTFSATDPDTRTNADGSVPSANLIVSGSTLYGTGTAGGYGHSGALFAIDTNTLAFTNLYNFQGSDGAAPAIQVLSGDSLYGTAGAGGLGGGLLFKINTNGTGWMSVHTFTATSLNTNADGAHPTALTLAGDTLYGTTTRGGANNQGVVFALRTNDLTFTTLHAFAPVVFGGIGFTNGDGSAPSGVIVAGNYLYGTAFGGGLGRGTLFALNTNGAGFATLYEFAPVITVITNDFFAATNSGGANPQSGLVLSGRALYGTASAGGIAGNGTIFQLALPDAVPLNLQQAGSTVILSWTNSLFSLQAAPTPGGVFTNLPNATSPCTNTITDGPEFFRLQSP